MLVVLQCLIIGAGPCGLRTAIDLSFLGAKVVVIEKRDAFSRNNVLHLWPFTIHDLRGLGAKKFYGKFAVFLARLISEVIGTSNEFELGTSLNTSLPQQAENSLHHTP